MISWLQDLPWIYVIIACLTLGLAPFVPPHIVEKIGMLANGELTRPIDIFDLFFHGAPWLLLLAKAAVELFAPSAA
ncbi:MAG: RND transporter [Persicimonas sp.]